MLLVPLAFASVAAPRSTHPQQENELARCSISSGDALYFWNVLSFSTGRLRQSKAVGGSSCQRLCLRPPDLTVPHSLTRHRQGRRTGGEGPQAPARPGKHNARALVCSGKKVGIWRRPSQQSRRWNAEGQTPFTHRLLVDPLTLELSPRFRRRSSSVASPVGSMRCIPQSRVECVHYRSVAFPAAVETHQ